MSLYLNTIVSSVSFFSCLFSCFFHILYFLHKTRCYNPPIILKPFENFGGNCHLWSTRILSMIILLIIMFGNIFLSNFLSLLFFVCLRSLNSVQKLLCWINIFWEKTTIENVFEFGRMGSSWICMTFFKRSCRFRFLFVTFVVSLWSTNENHLKNSHFGYYHNT